MLPKFRRVNPGPGAVLQRSCRTMHKIRREPRLGTRWVSAQRCTLGGTVHHQSTGANACHVMPRGALTLLDAAVLITLRCRRASTNAVFKGRAPTVAGVLEARFLSDAIFAGQYVEATPYPRGFCRDLPAHSAVVGWCHVHTRYTGVSPRRTASTRRAEKLFLSAGLVPVASGPLSSAALVLVPVACRANGHGNRPNCEPPANKAVELPWWLNVSARLECTYG